MSTNSDTDLNNLHKSNGKEEDLVDKEWQNSSASSNLDEKAFLELKSKYEELEDQYKRLWADQQNMMNRFNREKQEIVKYAASNTLETILPALDNFDFAKKSINPETNHEEIIRSIEMLQQQLLMCLKAVGLEEIETNNCTYNPEFHEAVSKIPDPSKAEGTIIDVLKKGFKVKDKVLRVATVVVSTKEEQ